MCKKTISRTQCAKKQYQRHDVQKNNIKDTMCKKTTLANNMKDTSTTGRSTAQFFLQANLLVRVRTKAHLTGYPCELCSVIFGEIFYGLYQSLLDWVPLNIVQVLEHWKNNWMLQVLFFATWRKFCSSWCRLGRTPCQCCTPQSGEDMVKGSCNYTVYLTPEKMARSLGMPNIQVWTCASEARTCKGQRPLKPMGFGSSAEVQKTQ